VKYQIGDKDRFSDPAHLHGSLPAAAHAAGSRGHPL